MKIAKTITLRNPKYFSASIGTFLANGTVSINVICANMKTAQFALISSVANYGITSWFTLQYFQSKIAADIIAKM